MEWSGKGRIFFCISSEGVAGEGERETKGKMLTANRPWGFFFLELRGKTENRFRGGASRGFLTEDG